MDIDNVVNITFGELVRLINGEMFITLNHCGVYGLIPIEIRFNYSLVNGKIQTTADEIMDQLKFNRENIEFMYQNQLLNKTRIIIDTNENFKDKIEQRLNQIKSKPICANETSGVASIWCYTIPCFRESKPYNPEQKVIKPPVTHTVETEDVIANNLMTDIYSSLIDKSAQKKINLLENRPKLMSVDDFTQK